MAGKNIALTLSGGGFRAMLFHLGVVRYLTLAGFLTHVKAISAVSGGAIIGAHLAHNWDRYTGDDDTFVETATALIRLARKDVRGRITRRLLIMWVWKLIGFFRGQKVTRGTLLRDELGKFYGKEAELLAAATNDSGTVPELHIIATNLTTGWSCSFSQRGFTHNDPKELVQLRTQALMTSEAVGASASFPAFFPPHSVEAADIGVDPEGWGFKRHYLTDGGVYDNLGIRNLRILQERGAGFDLIFISDGGATFAVEPGTKFYGLFRTAVRAADILFTRVAKLEFAMLSVAHSVKGLGAEFIRIGLDTEIADENSVPPQIQRAVRNIRTDLDRFSNTEIKWLIRLGFAAAKQAIEGKADELTALGMSPNPVSMPDPCKGLYKDRDLVDDMRHRHHDWKILQKSAARRWRIFAATDWPTYFNLAIVLLVTLLVFQGPSVVISDSQLFSAAYTEYYKVDVKYDENITNNWYNFIKDSDELNGINKEDREKIKSAVDSDSLVPIQDIEGTKSDKVRKILLQVNAYKKSAGLNGYGSAFFAIIPNEFHLATPDEFSGNSGESQIDAMFTNDNRWAGILYINFPFDEEEWYETLLKKIGVNIAWRESSILHFRGKSRTKKNELGDTSVIACLTFLQQPIKGAPRREYELGFKGTKEQLKAAFLIGDKTGEDAAPPAGAQSNGKKTGTEVPLMLGCEAEMSAARTKKSLKLGSFKLRRPAPFFTRVGNWLDKVLRWPKW